MKRISVVTPCYNEAGNVTELAERIRAVFRSFPEYEYEHLFIDNASLDGTVEELRKLAKDDPAIRVIVNRRNFGHVRSPIHGMLQASGDAVITLASDLQDPPELIRDFLARWEQGWKVVMGVRSGTDEGLLMSSVRRSYYELLARISDVEVVARATGFGLYDRAFVELLRQVDDPYPYGRGLAAEFGFDVALIPYHQPVRKRGVTKNNILTLYDAAMTGITTQSVLPLRLATLGGFILSGVSLAVGLVYLVYKLLFWSRFQAGVAPLVIGLALVFSLQLFFLGLLGEYVAVIHRRLLKRPLVVEKERINFG